MSSSLPKRCSYFISKLGDKIHTHDVRKYRFLNQLVLRMVPIVVKYNEHIVYYRDQNVFSTFTYYFLNSICIVSKNGARVEMTL